LETANKELTETLKKNEINLLKDEKLAEAEKKYQRLLKNFSSLQDKSTATENRYEKLVENFGRLELTLFVLSKFFLLLFIIFNSKYRPQKRKKKLPRSLSKKKKFLYRKMKRKMSI